MPPAVERLARNYLGCPLVVHIGTVGRPVERTEQAVHVCKENDKRNKLIDILNTGINPPISSSSSTRRRELMCWLKVSRFCTKEVSFETIFCY